jgi:hypothetical protein
MSRIFDDNGPELYDKKVEAYERLASKLKQNGIPIKLLIDFQKALAEFCFYVFKIKGL